MSKKTKEYIDICPACIFIVSFIGGLFILYCAYSIGHADGVMLGKRIERCNTGALDAISCQWSGLSHKGLSYN